jgi:heme/copper-type cytochrome/quinol oxidase subunit 2
MDMVDSFALPQMRVKQDAIPGIAQPVWFTPTLTGEWEAEETALLNAP